MLMRIRLESIRKDRRGFGWILTLKVARLLGIEMLVRVRWLRIYLELFSTLLIMKAILLIFLIYRNLLEHPIKILASMFSRLNWAISLRSIVSHIFLPICNVCILLVGRVLSMIGVEVIIAMDLIRTVWDYLREYRETGAVKKANNKYIRGNHSNN